MLCQLRRGVVRNKPWWEINASEAALNTVTECPTPCVFAKIDKSEADVGMT